MASKKCNNCACKDVCAYKPTGFETCHNWVPEWCKPVKELNSIFLETSESDERDQLREKAQHVINTAIEGLDFVISRHSPLDIAIVLAALRVRISSILETIPSYQKTFYDKLLKYIYHFRIDSDELRRQMEDLKKEKENPQSTEL